MSAAGLAAVAVCLPAARASAEPIDVVPGVSYERLVYAGPQVVNVIRVRQGPLIGIRPILTGNVPSQRTPLTTAMRARLGDGAVAAVNGDYFNLQNAYPSGLLMLDQELVNEPEPTRSALILESTGLLRSAQVALNGTWQAADPLNPTLGFEQRGFIGVNRPYERDTETVVYTPRYGELTPRGAGVVDALIDVDGGVAPKVNVPFVGTVQSVKDGGGSGVAPGKIVIAGIGAAGQRVLSDLVPGRRVVVNFAVSGLAPESLHGLGGGPVLVSEGAPIPSAGEGFSPGQINQRTSRTAIGQAADGSVLLVTAEGSSQGSAGVDTAVMANLMASLGSRTAIGMDSGGSSTMTVRDQLVQPAGGDRSITNALMVTYAGVQLTPPLSFITPNNDGSDDSTTTVVRSAKPGSVRVTLASRTGRTIKVLYRGPLGPSGRKIRLGRSAVGLREGQFRVVAKFTPDDRSIRTSHRHAFIADRTAGFLKLRKIGKRPKTRLQIRFRLTRPARVTIRVRDENAVDKKLIARNAVFGAGEHVVTWDLKRKGKPLPKGVYVVGVRVDTPRGPATLSARFSARKPPPEPKPPTESTNPPATP
jgi:hypothetical protein